MPEALAIPGWLYHSIAIGSALLFVGLELRSPTFRDLSFRDKVRAPRNWAFFASSVGVMIALRHLTTGLEQVLPRIADWGHHVALNLIGCFLVAELFGWLCHWAKHKHSYLWRFHFQHHNEEHYNIWMVTHTHGFEVLLSGLVMGTLLITLGFTSFSVQIYLLFYAAANTYQHSEFDYSLGWLDKLIVNPAYHTYHHAVGSAANYGNTLTVWDVVFRTARWPATATKRATKIGIARGQQAGEAEPFGFVPEMLWFAQPAVTAGARSIQAAQAALHKAPAPRRHSSASSSGERMRFAS